MVTITVRVTVMGEFFGYAIKITREKEKDDALYDIEACWYLGCKPAYMACKSQNL
jgi:hypothetical protein